MQGTTSQHFDSVTLDLMELPVKDSERLMVSTFIQDTKELVVEKGNAYHISPLANPEAFSGELQFWQRVFRMKPHQDSE